MSPMIEAAVVGPDGPEEMGRELAEGPQAVQATLAAIDASNDVVAGLLRRARRLVLVGTGASMAMADTAAPLWRIAARSRGDARPLLLREASSVAFGVDGEDIGASDVVIIVSYRGTSPETVAAAELARRAGAPVIAVTRPDPSPLTDVATRLVEVRCGHEERSAATKSELATLAALLALGTVLPTDAGSRDGLRARLEAAVRDWEPCALLGQALARSEHTWVLGLGAGEGVARAASLLWHEKVVRPAVPLSPSAFRHGPAEAVRQGDAVVVIDIGPSSASQVMYLDLLASELRRLECVSAWIGPRRPDAMDGIDLADRDAAAGLEATLRVQQLARATAIAAGTYVERFRVLLDIVRPSPPLI